jgi:hypothetical protein
MKPQELVPILKKPPWLYRPYYFKLDSYEYEREVRPVIAVDNNRMRKKRSAGVVVGVNPDALIEKVLISPHVNREEAECLTDLIQGGTRRLKCEVDTSLLLNMGASQSVSGLQKEKSGSLKDSPFLGEAFNAGTPEGRLFSSHAV